VKFMKTTGTLKNGRFQRFPISSNQFQSLLKKW